MRTINLLVFISFIEHENIIVYTYHQLMNEVVRKIKDSIMFLCKWCVAASIWICKTLWLLHTSIGNGIDILQRKIQQRLRVITSFATYTVNAFVSLIRLDTVLYILKSNSFDYNIFGYPVRIPCMYGWTLHYYYI